MDDNSLTDKQIMLLTKAALDNNAAIIQFSSQIYGLAKDVKPSHQKRWRDQFIKQWRKYDENVKDILNIEEVV